MALMTGTHDISHLIAARDQSIVEYGQNRIAEILGRDLAAHNALVMDILTGLCEGTTDRQRRYGGSISGQMVEVDEYGRSPTQRAVTGSTVGFPMRLFQFAVGWTEKWMQNHTPADMAMMTIQAQNAHLAALHREIRKALYLTANYTFRDFLVDNVDLPVKRLVNADGMAIPNGPFGDEFNAATHTHYLARAGGSLAGSDVTRAIDTVAEHRRGTDIKIAINKADETAWRVLLGATNLYPDPRIVYRASDTPGMTLDQTQTDNRAIGIYGSAEVWVKPWAIANYPFVWDANGPKPLGFRQRTTESQQGLRIAATLNTFPLHAEYMEAEFGVGVSERTNGAVLYTGDTTYADPTIQ